MQPSKVFFGKFVVFYFPYFWCLSELSQLLEDQLHTRETIKMTTFVFSSCTIFFSFLEMLVHWYSVNKNQTYVLNYRPSSYGNRENPFLQKFKHCVPCRYTVYFYKCSENSKCTKKEPNSVN